MTALDAGAPLLETKLYAPRVRRGLVARPRLVERLTRGVESRLTLVSAPAGFGKTTLLAAWLSAAPSAGPSVAWLSLDGADNQPVSFWTYLISALQGVAPGVGATALALLQERQSPLETVLGTLLNDLGALPNDVTLVLDDYHVIEAQEVQAGMAYLIEHLPAHLHVVLLTRADPGLPLALLRSHGELAEIRAADLRFTTDEAAAYLNEAMGLAMTERDIAALEERTEGWIAALQLAALSMQGRDDVAGFIAGFAGDDRYIVDYLVEEVLQRQSAQVRSFLLETSILDRLHGPLCDAVTAQDGGRAMLEALDRGNLFLVALDDRRRWYRYHHLFADVLRAHLIDEQPEAVPALHRRASEWYEANGQRSEAIRHALAGEDLERAADLVELAIPALRQARQEATMRLWLAALDEADKFYASDYFPNVRPIAALRARVWIVQGRLDEASDWAHEAGLAPDDDLGYVREFEQITLARLLLARSKRNGGEPSRLAGARLLERLLVAAEGGDRRGAVIEILVMQALAQQLRGDLRAALLPLGHALALAEPEGYLRVFIDEGAPMAILLEAAARQGLAPAYLRRLLAAVAHPGTPTPVEDALIEPLSERELEVLRLLASDLDGPGIAAELVVSLNTVRSHTKNIYAKLGVNNRRAAVSRATELNLLSRSQRP
jgi:ATP/maltotriose-dependent transcriptional regulator MalT